jgi:hypothetical protein
MLTSENYKKLLMQIKAPVLFFTGQHDRRDAVRSSRFHHHHHT